MKKIYKIKLIATFAIIALLNACSTDADGFKRLDNGLRYKFIETNPNMPKAKLDDVLVLNFEYKDKSGKTIFSSTEVDIYRKRLQEPSHPGGSLEDALAMMHLGDSAIFKINAINFLRFTENFQKIPEDLNQNDYYIFYIRLKEILEQEFFDSHLIKKYLENEKIELELLEKYLERTNITVEPEISGIFYIENQKGEGDLIKTGDLIEMYYTGRFIDGKVFGTNYGQSPMQVRVGFGHVIRGMDIGLQLMKNGGKATLIIPSRLAYGEEGNIGILPYSTLIFDIEIVKVY